MLFKECYQCIPLGMYEEVKSYIHESVTFIVVLEQFSYVLLMCDVGEGLKLEKR